MTHLLVTNDYPPKVGGIQNYLWELYRRLPREEFAILTTPYDGAADFDRHQPYRIERFRRFWLTPTPDVRRHAERMIREIDASFVLFDPAFPLGYLGRSLSVPYGVVLHGAEVTVPARLPGIRTMLAKTIEAAAMVVSASDYALREAERLVGRSLEAVYIPPGVDIDRFLPLGEEQRRSTRRHFGLDPDAPLVVSVSRLVPRKGMDRLIEAAAQLRGEFPGLQVVIVGTGRDRKRLERLVGRTGAPVRFAGKVGDADLPALVGAADVFAMICRSRWGGLEQEGFGIVFVEAAAAGVAQVAGASGGAAEAVTDQETGLLVADPSSTADAAGALRRLLNDANLRRAMGTASRRRAVAEFDYDLLANRLLAAVHRHGG